MGFLFHYGWFIVFFLRAKKLKKRFAFCGFFSFLEGMCKSRFINLRLLFFLPLFLAVAVFILVLSVWAFEEGFWVMYIAALLFHMRRRKVNSFYTFFFWQTWLILRIYTLNLIWNFPYVVAFALCFLEIDFGAVYLFCEMFQHDDIISTREMAHCFLASNMNIKRI